MKRESSLDADLIHETIKFSLLRSEISWQQSKKNVRKKSEKQNKMLEKIYRENAHNPCGASNDINLNQNHYQFIAFLMTVPMF